MLGWHGKLRFLKIGAQGSTARNGKRNSHSFWTLRKSWRGALTLKQVVAHPPTGTINCLAVNAKGDISGTTTTSGLAWKIAGRVGDSPIIGAGLFVDNEIGAAGSTGQRRRKHQDLPVATPSWK